MQAIQKFDGIDPPDIMNSLTFCDNSIEIMFWAPTLVLLILQILNLY